MEATLEEMLNLANFSDAPPPGYRRRVGPMFQLGDYPDKRFSLNEEEADRAIAKFEPVAADMEHIPTLLDNKLGVLRKVFRKDRWIHGEADVPEWLDDALKGTASGVSLAFDYDKKDIKGWAWTVEPRITGAALMSKYAAFTARQRAEDTSTQTGADLLVPKMAETPRRKGMANVLDSLKAQFAKRAPKPEAAPAEEPKAPTINFTAPGTAEEGEEEEASSQALADFKADQIITRATEAVDKAIADGHLFSAGREAALAAFTAAGYDNDQQGPSVVTFSRADGTVVADRVSLLAEVLQHTPQHSLFHKSLPVYVLNGDRSPEEKVSAAEQGKQQAAEFNAQKGGGEPDPTKVAMNGHR